MKNSKNDLKAEFLVATIITTIMVVICITGAKWRCWQTFDDTKYEYRYSMLKGCQYKVENGWYPLNKFLSVEINQGGK